MANYWLGPRLVRAQNFPPLTRARLPDFLDRCPNGSTKRSDRAPVGCAIYQGTQSWYAFTFVCTMHPS